MLLKGQLFATSDINMVNHALSQGVKIIYLGDPISVPDMYKSVFVTATSLFPDYNTMAMQIEGNEQGFVQMYTASLNSKAAMEMLSVIIACLYKGTNIILYVPQEASGLNFAQYLLRFIEYNFGIVTQTRSTKFAFNPEFSNKIIELLYLNNLVTPQEFLVNSEKLNEFTIRKLVAEIRPMVDDPRDIDCIVKWFANYKDQLIKANKPLVYGVQYAGKDSDYGCF